MRILTHDPDGRVLFCACGLRSRTDSDLAEDDIASCGVTIGNRTVRLEALVREEARRAGQASDRADRPWQAWRREGRMLDERSGEYARQARDLARRGWLAVVAMRRGYGGSRRTGLGAAHLRRAPRCSSGSPQTPTTCRRTLAAVAKRPDADGTRMVAIGVIGRWRGSCRARGAQSAGARWRDQRLGRPALPELSEGGRPRRGVQGATARRAACRTCGSTPRTTATFPSELVARMQNAFLDGGGRREAGHVRRRRALRRSRARSADPNWLAARWLPQMRMRFAAFPASVPTWTRDDVNALITEARTSRRSRAALSKTMWRGLPKRRWCARSRAARVNGELAPMAPTRCETAPHDRGLRAAAKSRGQPLRSAVMLNDAWVSLPAT